MPPFVRQDQCRSAYAFAPVHSAMTPIQPMTAVNARILTVLLAYAVCVGHQGLKTRGSQIQFFLLRVESRWPERVVGQVLYGIR